MLQYFVILRPRPGYGGGGGGGEFRRMRFSPDRRRDMSPPPKRPRGGWEDERWEATHCWNLTLHTTYLLYLSIYCTSIYILSFVSFHLLYTYLSICVYLNQCIFSISGVMGVHMTGSLSGSLTGPRPLGRTVSSENRSLSIENCSCIAKPKEIVFVFVFNLRMIY